MNETFNLLSQMVLSWALCLPRILAAFTVVPFLSTGYVSGITRNCLGASFALILFPTVFPMVENEKISAIVFISILAKETVIGVGLGYMIGLFFWGIQAIGQVIDYQRGSGIAEAYDPTFGGEMSPIGNLLMPLAMLIFFSSGGFLVFLSAIYKSFQAWPIFSYLPIPGPKVAIFSLEKIDSYMKMVLIFAAPLLIIMFISDIGMGLINRFAPQINIFILSMPIKSVLVIFCFILYLPFLVNHLKKIIYQNANVFEILNTIMR
jgi:type III secretion protein T